MNLVLGLIYPLLATLAASLIYWFFDLLKRHRKLIVLLRAFANECKFNQVHRGNKQNPFRDYWLEKILCNFEFYEKCKELHGECLELCELIPEANLEQLKRRGYEPSSVQDKCRVIQKSIENKISILEKPFSICGYFRYKFSPQKIFNAKR